MSVFHMRSRRRLRELFCFRVCLFSRCGSHSFAILHRVANVVGYFRWHFRFVSIVVGVECMDLCRLNVLVGCILAC